MCSKPGYNPTTTSRDSTTQDVITTSSNHKLENTYYIDVTHLNPIRVESTVIGDLNQDTGKPTYDTNLNPMYDTYLNTLFQRIIDS